MPGCPYSERRKGREARAGLLPIPLQGLPQQAQATWLRSERVPNRSAPGGSLEGRGSTEYGDGLHVSPSPGTEMGPMHRHTMDLFGEFEQLRAVRKSRPRWRLAAEWLEPVQGSWTLQSDWTVQKGYGLHTVAGDARYGADLALGALR